MQTLSGFCNRQQLADYSACARQRINATGARTIFIATMHQRDRQRMASLLKGSGAEVTYSTFAPAAERVQSGVKSQEDARVVDIWLVARGTELLLSPSSTMGYMSMALASPTAVITMLDKCLPRPSREATFHRIFSSTGHSANSTCRRALEQTRRMLPHEERSIPLSAFSESIQVFAFEEQDVAAKALLGRFAKQNFTLAHEIVARSVDGVEQLMARSGLSHVELYYKRNLFAAKIQSTFHKELALGDRYFIKTKITKVTGSLMDIRVAFLDERETLCFEILWTILIVLDSNERVLLDWENVDLMEGKRLRAGPGKSRVEAPATPKKRAKTSEKDERETETRA